MLSTNYKNQIIDICCRMISTDGEVSLQERIWMVKLCDTNEKARRIIDVDGCHRLEFVRDGFAALDDWTEESLESWVREFSERTGIKLGKAAQPIRAAITGTTVSPSIFEVLVVLGREESLGRIGDAIDGG